jgi:hypothetical protein
LLLLLALGGGFLLGFGVLGLLGLGLLGEFSGLELGGLILLVLLRDFGFFSLGLPG